jgi:hypothetical protein
MILSYSRKLKIKHWVLSVVLYMSILLWIPILIILPSKIMILLWGVSFFTIVFGVFFFSKKKIILRKDEFLQRIKLSLYQVSRHKIDQIYLKHNNNILYFNVAISYKLYFSKQFEKEWKEIFSNYLHDYSTLAVKTSYDYFINLCYNCEELINFEQVGISLLENYYLIPFEFFPVNEQNEHSSRLYALVEINKDSYYVLNIYCTELIEDIPQDYIKYTLSSTCI